VRASPTARTDRILTIPNALSMLRIATIPLFVFLIVHRETTFSGVIVFAVVASTDWLDGAVARATGQVSEFGKILDPVADRLAIAAGLIALVVREAFPLWAAVAIVGRDVAVLVAGVALLSRKIRIEVRYVGKVATFSLMIAIGAIAWGELGYALAPSFLSVGWVAFAVGIVESYVAAWLYARDVRAALGRRG
jgi:cardiolipin synthase (CMP-forming)